jgi:lipopolysaccharide/colanic/teichoic acid biosynthesis glycosyltransferase
VKKPNILSSTYLFVARPAKSRPYRGKRVFDLVTALILFLILSPGLVLISLFILITSGRPIIYRQRRSIPGGKPFIIYKFRTMKNSTEEITLPGRILRPCHLDELPQLINILQGDMSLVGPRPFTIERVNSVPKDYLPLGHNLLPGLSGFGQIIKKWRKNNYDDLLARLDYDLLYLKNCSWSNDLLILCKTIKVCIRGIGS